MRTTGIDPDREEFRVSRVGERVYFTAAAVLLAFAVIGAFVPSFFLRTAFHRPAPTPFIAAHGVLMTVWMLLFAVQSLLVAAGKTGWHRQLGYAGVVFAGLLVPIGCMATLAAAAREVHAHSAAVPVQLNVLGLELAQMSLFGGFVAAATVLRRRVDWHKRLMLMATLCLLPNAIVRLSMMPAFAFLSSNLVIIGAWVGVLVVAAAADALRTRSVHPAFVNGMPLAAGLIYAAWALSQTPAWDSFWTRSLA